LEVDSHEIPLLDQRLSQIAPPFNIIKVKVFAPDGEVVYSTDHSIIGRKDSGNLRLQRALNGYNDSQLQTKGEVFDLADERRFDVDVVESYIPIRNEHHEVVGSFEVYLDITRYRDSIQASVLQAVVVLVLIILLVYTSAFMVVRIALKRLGDAQAELQQLATRDGLTGLLNRREVMRRAQQEVARYRREYDKQTQANPLSLVMVDVDHFKSINDRFGHQRGDQVLVAIADLIKSQLREYNLVGRYGGEEFLIVLPSTAWREALSVAERIRSLAADRQYGDSVTPLRATLSMGVATLEQDEELDQLIRRADAGLYSAKQRGRNRVEMDAPCDQRA
ncbi:MAG TPA: GGDEF domain-containing protein, partial [Motiliproteus sp.]